MKILTVLGARPQFIKASPISSALKKTGITEIIINTGQHYDANMSDIFFKDLNIPVAKYNLNIDITSKAIKNRMIEVNTKLTFMDKGTSKKKSFFEIAYVSIVKINENVKDSKEIEKIILCDVQNEIYPNLEKIFENLLNDSGYRSIKFEKKIDFEKLYNQRIN